MPIDVKQVQDFTAQYWNGVVVRVRESLESVRPKQTGLTSQSILAFNKNLVSSRGPSSLKMEIHMPEHYKYLDEGVQGAKPTKGRTNSGRFRYTKKIPPIHGPGKILNWMQARQIVPKEYKKGTKGTEKTKMFERLAWAISWSIFREGLQQTNFFSNVINDDLLKDFEEKLTEFAGQQVFLDIETSIKK